MISNTHKPASAWTNPSHSHSPSSSPESHSRPIPRMTSPSASIHVPHDHLLQPSQLHHTSSRTSISSGRRPDVPLTSPSNLEIPMMPHVQVTPTSTPSAQERSSISFNAKPHGRKRTSSIPEDTPQLSPAPHQKGSFEFRFNDSASNAQRGFINNSIRTSKYNILTFLPVNLFEQFRRLANAYFLIIVIIQSIPAVSPFPVWTSLAPLCFILGVSATKEALEDYRRHKADNIANNRLYQVVIESTPEKEIHPTHVTREQQLAKHASLSQVDSSAVLRTVASKDITVGSILKITKDQEFPADCVLLSTSRIDSTCYVNTAALDGEAVPKVRVAPPSTLMYQNARQLSYLHGSIMCEPPNSSLYHFQGRLTLEQSIQLNDLVKVQEEEQAASAGMNAEDAAKYAQYQKRKDRAKNDVDHTRISALGDQQLLLRGSKLANTEWCYCVVAYTGIVTKMMLNRNPARFKFSRFESILNKMVLIMFLFNLICCILLAVAYSIRDYEFINWLDRYYPTDRDEPLIDSPVLGSIKNFATQYILFSFMIPMSLYVTIELVKVGQAQFMEWDSRMSYKEEDGVTHKMQVKASSLNEELGMVDYIFSDKTGTLTCNRMELSRCSINGLLYKEIRPIDKMSQPNTPEMPGKKLSTATSTGTIGCTVHDEPLQQSPLQTAHHIPTSSMDGVRRASIELASFSKHEISPVLTTTATSSHHSDESDRDCKLMSDVVRAAFSGYGDQNDSHSDPAREFLFNILVNNSVLPSIRPRPAHHKHSSVRHKPDEHKDDIDWMFQSQSPDEIALMEALYRSGVFLMERTGNHLTVRCQIPGQAVRDIEIEIVAILEFTSTRARMSVVTRTSDGRYMLYVKGADSTVIKLVDQSTSATSQLAEKTLRHTTEFAGTGSRTLLMAGKEIPQAYAMTWLQTYQDAITSLDAREHKVESAFAQLEHHCQLLGCSAVDDQLQEYVPETIELLLKAGLKVIVLTGDKLETAVTIARESRLVQPHMHLLHIKGNTPETCSESLQTTLHHVTQIKSNYHHARQQEAEFAMAIEGACLEMCLTHCQAVFLQLFLICHTVISYRSTPMQKALAVRLVKKSLNQTCLAIGDGANDVSMIQEAHVGVGIMGKEGSHAAMSSDFVLRRFHHLTYLLFLHGRYSFYRTAMVVYFSFYKNMVFPFPQFWFSFFSLNTGQTLYIALLISAFNLFLTSLPPIIVGIMEKDVHDSFLLCNPMAYKAFKDQCVFKVSKFLKWLIRGVWHGLVFYFVAHFIFSRQDVIFPSGQIEGIWFMGVLILMTLCFTVNIQMTLATKYITIYNIIAAILGMIAFILILAILSSSYWVTLAPDAYQLLQHLFDTHIFWSYALLSFVICMFPILVINSLSSSFPSTISEQLRIFSKQSHPTQPHGSELVSIVPATSETEKRRYL